MSEEEPFGDIGCVCQNCGREFEINTGTSNTALDQCSRCGSYDVVRYEDLPDDDEIAATVTADEWLEEDTE